MAYVPGIGQVSNHKLILGALAVGGLGAAAAYVGPSVALGKVGSTVSALFSGSETVAAVLGGGGASGGVASTAASTIAAAGGTSTAASAAATKLATGSVVVVDTAGQASVVVQEVVVKVVNAVSYVCGKDFHNAAKFAECLTTLMKV